MLLAHDRITSRPVFTLPVKDTFEIAGSSHNKRPVVASPCRMLNPPAGKPHSVRISPKTTEVKGVNWDGL